MIFMLASSGPHEVDKNTQDKTMDLSTLREVCKRYSAPEYCTEPIPEAKAVNARARLQIGNSETIVAHIDVTINNAAIRRAIVITDVGICWRNVSEDMKGKPPQRLSWTQLRDRPVLEKVADSRKSIELGFGLEIELSGATSLIEPGNHLVRDLLLELRGFAEDPPKNPTFGAMPARTNGAETNATLTVSPERKLHLLRLVTACKQYAERRSLHLQKLQDACRRYKGCANEYFVDSVPQTKALNARQSLKIPRRETVIALIDLTIWGGARESIAVTDGGLYWKEIADVSATTLSWAQIGQRAPMEKQGLINKSIQFGDNVSMPLMSATTFNARDNHVVIEMINALLTAGLSAKRQEKNIVEQTVEPTGMVACEFCEAKIKPEVTYCKHCGIKLRG